MDLFLSLDVHKIQGAPEVALSKRAHNIKWIAIKHKKSRKDCLLLRFILEYF